MNRVRLAIHGAAGRMGRRLVALADADPRFELVGAVDRADHPQIGHDAGRLAGAGDIGLPLSSQLPDSAQVVIDFSTPEACEVVTQWCREHQVALVAATTGLSDQQKHVLGEAAHEIPVLWAPNMSLAVNLTMQLALMAADVLHRIEGDVDVEVIERHHRYKEDAPSGTALWFGEAIAAKMGQQHHRHGRHGRIGRRPADEIGYHSLRVGDNPGEHTIVFGMLGETVELTVKATSRDCYAVGALEAAAYLASKPPGHYSINDVLGLNGCRGE